MQHQSPQFLVLLTLKQELRLSDAQGDSHFSSMKLSLPNGQCTLLIRLHRGTLGE